MKKSLIIFASDNHVKNSIFKTISNVLGNVVTIHAVSLEEGFNIPEDIGYCVVLVSHDYFIPEARKYFPDSPIISGKKVLNVLNLEKVLALPANKKVLVINSPQISAEETVADLINLGIEHLDLIPFWKDSPVDISDIDTAISPGRLHLCPPSIKHKIDLGIRTFSVQTFLEILHHLELDLSYLNSFVNEYLHLLLLNNRKLADSLHHSELLRKQQEIILNQMDDGVLLVDDNVITFANPAIKHIFGKSAVDLADKNIDILFNKLKNLNNTAVTSAASINDSLFYYEDENKNIICNKIAIGFNYVSKRYLYTFKEASKIQTLEKKVRLEILKKGYVAKYNFRDIWGNNAKLNKVKEKALKFARTENTILITGESGTGKELFAQAIHNNSQRNGGPFLAINFAAIPESLVESELFGYEGGAFTGARKDGKEGVFEQAHEGTIFLDEIGDAPLFIQARLLRVLQEREVMRIGGTKITPVNIRIIAATNRNLQKLVEENKFRHDLFYRLNVLPIQLPALREFREDVALILEKYWFNKYKCKKAIGKDVLRILLGYSWPGNVRELINIADYIYYSSEDREEICINDIPEHFINSMHSPTETTNYTELLDNLGKEVNIEELLSILRLFSPPYNKHHSRSSLIEALNTSGISISEYKIRKYLAILNDYGLIVIGKTKQGSSLTRKGIELLEASKVKNYPV